MTKPSHGSSLLQARDSRSHSHSHSFFHRFRHRLLHAHDPEQRSFGDDAASDNGFGHHLGANVELDSSNNALAKRDSSETTQQVAVNAVGDEQTSLVTHVRQTISLVQYVDPWGSTYETKTIYSPPNTIVVDPQSGKTIDTSSGPESTVALPGPTPSGSGYSSSSLDSATSTSLGPVPTSTTPSSATVKPAYPSVGGIRNSTSSAFHSNSSFAAPSNSSSIYKLSSSSVTISTTDSSTTSETKSTSKSTHSTHLTSSASSSSSSSSPSSSSSSSLSSSSFSSATTTAPGNGYGTITVPGSLPTTQSETGSSSGDSLTPQLKQVIGGVVGAVAGVAVIGLLLMLFLRWKKKKGSPTILNNQSGGATSRTLGAGTPGDSGSEGAMAERAAAPGAVAAALASLTGKRAPQTSHSADSGERGFYRVSGRKLPSVLHNGGDGYSDPRGSATSGSSDYYRGSQAFEPTSAGKGQLALGVPMRPVSGVPIIRSGPARIPITQNPFADPPASTNNLSTRTLGSGESPRASGSKFQEKI
ncbi:hypothetical protein J3458_022225 [Metarhizium acridum]|uniref:uncharacterized protein n=1 Tax=Metarhizium acridum TaxID=92637 RepID=UPI001C6AAF47|nr:hypothetical protein J3458_022225 [Metarhizium acridum]